MKMLHTVSLAAVIAVATIVAAVAANAPNRPPGVSADEWAPISDTLGIVLMDQLTGAADAPGARVQWQSAAVGRRSGAQGGASLIPPATGYLMVKRGNTWQRLIVVDPVKGPGEAG